MNSIPDNYDLWKRHESQLEEAISNLPLCDWCGEHIQEESYYDINNEKVCEYCIKEARRLI